MTKRVHAELKKKRPEELEKDLVNTRIEIMKLNAQVAAGGAAKEAGKLRSLRKKIARIKTILRGTESQ